MGSGASSLLAVALTVTLTSVAGGFASRPRASPDLCPLVACPASSLSCVWSPDSPSPLLGVHDSWILFVTRFPRLSGVWM